jgi:hypothetical protein
MQVHFKLGKLAGLLRGLTTVQPGDANYNSIFMRIVGTLIEVRQEADWEKSRQALEALTTVMVTFKGSPNLLLYGERLKSLAHEQIAALKEPSAGPSSDVKAWILSARRALVPIKLARIRSETSSDHALQSDASIGLETEQDQFDVAERPEFINAGDMQRSFYSKCIAMKLQYNSRHPAQRVSIAKLYEEVRKLRLSMDSWAAFIQKELESPRKGALRGLRSSGSYKIKTPSISIQTITEVPETPSNSVTFDNKLTESSSKPFREGLAYIPNQSALGLHEA